MDNLTLSRRLALLLVWTALLLVAWIEALDRPQDTAERLYWARGAGLNLAVSLVGSALAYASLTTKKLGGALEIIAAIFLVVILGMFAHMLLT